MDNSATSAPKGFKKEEFADEDCEEDCEEEEDSEGEEDDV